MDRKRDRWWVLFGMCLITVMLAIDATALNIAIPVIANEFYASLTEMQWVINAFFLLSAVVQIIGGQLGDIQGHKKIFLINVILFIISSAGAGLSTNEYMLIAFRGLQGASVGIASPLSIVLISDIFPKKEQSFARSFVVAAMGIALAIGAPLGGLFVHTIGWRWIFFINIPIGVICYLVTQVYCPSQKRKGTGSIDFKSAAVLVLSLFAIAFAFNQVQNWGFGSLSFIGWLGMGFLLLGGLYFHERKKKNPLVEFKLFKNRNFTINSLIRTIVQIVFLGILFFLPLYLENISEVSALMSGLTMFTLTLVMSLVSPLAGKWVDKKGEKIANFLSMIFLGSASLLFLFVDSKLNYYLLSSALFLAGIGIAIAFVSTTTGALVGAVQKKLGTISGLFFTIAWLSCSLGVSLTGTNIAYTSDVSFPSEIKNEKIILNPKQLAFAKRAARGLAPMNSLDGKVAEKNLEPLKRASASSFIKGVQISGGLYLALSLFGAVLCWFTLSPKGKKSVRSSQ